MTKVGDSIIAENANWTFGGRVADSFDDHVSKSVPLYDVGHDLALKISDYFLTNGTLCYDLGCSTGTLLQALATRHRAKDVEFIGIDAEDGMVEHARRKVEHFPSATVVKGDVIDMQFKSADLIVAYYMFQFVRPKHRQNLFNQIYESLNWGGGFLLFEKVRACDARFQDMMTGLYTDYKIDQEYSPEEIVGKTRSLKGVMEPFSTQGNLDLLKRAGFVDVMTVFKYVCFEGFLAIK
jgi:tRNA (cmo5U34)-methyltransferase